MVQINDPASCWQQLSSFFFLSSGFFSDILAIRMCLTAAYIFLLTTGYLGHPPWKNSFREQERISIDTMVWAILNLGTHGFAFARLLWDERRVQLKENEEPLWRCFYRHSGLSRALFKKLVSSHVELVEFKEGASIPIKDSFYMVLEGIVEATMEVSKKRYQVTLVSGQMFPLRYLQQFYVPQKNMFAKQTIFPIAKSRVLAYRFQKSHLQRLSRMNAAKDAWHAVLISALAKISERCYLRLHLSSQLSSDADFTTCPGVFIEEGIMDECRLRRDPIFRKLEEWEQPNASSSGSGLAMTVPLAHIIRSLKLSFTIPWPIGPWPVGLRHGSLPAPHAPDDSDDDNVYEEMMLDEEQPAALSHQQEGTQNN